MMFVVKPFITWVKLHFLVRESYVVATYSNLLLLLQLEYNFLHYYCSNLQSIVQHLLIYDHFVALPFSIKN